MSTPATAARANDRAALASSDARFDLAQDVLGRVAVDLAMITEREIRVRDIAVASSRERPRAHGGVHIAFKHAYRRSDRIDHGCLLVSLPDAIAIGGYFLMLSDDEITRRRGATTLDTLIKDALLEVSSFVASSLHAGYLGLGVAGLHVRSESCQGVRADASPALDHTPGSELWIARAALSIHTWPVSSAVLVLPPLDAPPSDAKG